LIAHAKQKVREGKIVKVEVDYDESINKLKITGDFFLHPEDVLDEIEKSLSGLEKEASVEAIASKIHTIMAAHDARMIGISPESLARVVKEALK
jgi:lipoate-protein ligase A